MATIKLVPSTYYRSNSSYVTVTDPDNMYDVCDSTDYASIRNSRNSTSNTYYCYLRGFDFDSVPSNAIVSGFEIRIRAYESYMSTSSSYRMSLYDGTSSISNTTCTSSLSTTARTYEFPIPSTLTWETLKGYGSDFGIRIPLRRSSTSYNSLPTIYGEKIVIRLLMRESSTLTRRGIGITERDNAKFDRILKNTSGVILIVGPTGSGKTSTLYTMINELKDEAVNMISLEDPVEFQIEGVAQVAINEKVGLTFASALRACLRQDPDIICIGEIRDGETAEIAMRAAMTGHLVLSTIHTEDTVAAIDRLKDMGIEPYLIAGAVRGVVSQRLVRRICPNCKEEYEPDPDLVEIVGMDEASLRKSKYTVDEDVFETTDGASGDASDDGVEETPVKKIRFYHGAGCHQCFDSGYRGRTGVFEILPITAQLRDKISEGVTGSELRREVSKDPNFVPMIVNGRDLVREGVTTVDELVRTIVTVE